MSDDKRSEIVEKIKKLLAHSVENGATEAEAVAFALKAQRLIAENDIEEWELGDKSERVVVENLSEYNAKRSWMKFLATVVAEAFRRSTFTRHQGTRKQRRHNMVFVGYKSDAEAASIVFERLVRVCERISQAERRRYNGAAWAYNSMSIGFIDGVKKELEKQTQALMLVVPHEVSEHMKALKLKKQRRLGSVEVERDLLARGHEAGRDAVRSGRLGQEDASFMLSA